MRRDAIRDLPYQHNLKPGLGVEVLRLAELVRRVGVDELAVPRRPEFHTVYLGLRGRGEVTIDFTPMPIEPRRLTVLARGRVQQFTDVRDVDAWMVLFVPEAVALDVNVLASTWAEPTLELSAADRRELAALFEQLAAEQDRPLDAIQPALLATLLRTVLLRAERLVVSDADRAPPPAELQRFFTILERDCLRTRSVAHYAKAAGISARRLGELLVDHAGRSTKEVIDDRVVLEQKRLLAHTDMSVKVLAERTGFDEPTNLVKFFRHRTGMTPQAFRMNLPSGRRS